MMFLFFFKIAFAHALAVMSPGPDFAVILKNTLQHGRGAGFKTAWGIASGIVVHVTVSLLGVGIMMATHPLIKIWIQRLGAGVLLWMAGKILWDVRARRAVPLPSYVTENHKIRGNHFLEGFLTNVLNPKATLFFLSLLTGLIPAGASMAFRILCGLEMIIATGLWFSCVSLVASQPRFELFLKKQTRILNFILALVLLYFAGKLAFFS